VPSSGAASVLAVSGDPEAVDDRIEASSGAHRRPSAPRLAPMAEPPERAVRIERVRKAYEQVADQLRDLILRGAIPPGQRLPDEASRSDRITDDHRAIAAAIAAGDEDAAAEEMHRHLAYLRPFYEKAWRSLKR
jgi:DNA-binding FadR family transcriptional regulator